MPMGNSPQTVFMTIHRPLRPRNMLRPIGRSGFIIAGNRPETSQYGDLFADAGVTLCRRTSAP